MPVAPVFEETDVLARVFAIWMVVSKGSYLDSPILGAEMRKAATF